MITNTKENGFETLIVDYLVTQSQYKGELPGAISEKYYLKGKGNYFVS